MSMTTFNEALNLAKSEKTLGNIADFYVSPDTGSIIAESPDGGEYVWFGKDDEEEF
jgi:hypothetical protein